MVVTHLGGPTYLWYTFIMARSIRVHQKRRGRPATGRDPAVTVRIPETVLLAVDRFAEMQLAAPSRSEAIRRLVEIGLESLKGKSAQK